MSNRIDRIEVVEDRTAGSTCDEGFLRLRRLTLQNVFDDGTRSRPYACDIVSRRYVDAVAVVLCERVEDADGSLSVRVALRTGFRPPVALRSAGELAHDDGVEIELLEIVAGVLEDDDAFEGGVEKRAVEECLEEAGIRVDRADVEPLGGGLYPSPGVTDERVHFRYAEADLDDRSTPAGDGSPMEDGQVVILMPLREAIRRCRSGEIPDMKTEIALLRLCDALGYVAALDRFVDDLPEPIRQAAADLPPLI